LHIDCQRWLVETTLRRSSGLRVSLRLPTNSSLCNLSPADYEALHIAAEIAA